MLRLIIFAAIIVWIIYNITKAGRTQSKDRQDPAQPKRGKAPGRKYSWPWMQTAGALELQFIRPEAANGYPAITGEIHGIGISVQCVPPMDFGLTFSQPFTAFHFRFPKPARLGLKLFAGTDPATVKQIFGGKDALPLQKLLNTGDVPDCVLEVDDPERLKHCLSEECLAHLTQMSRIYPWILLTDSELQVQAPGIREDAQSFQRELEALLEVASDFARFTAKAAAIPDRVKPADAQKKEVTPEPPCEKAHDGKTITAEPEARKEAPAQPGKNRPETVPDETGKEAPAPSQPPAGMPERTVFLQSLWSEGNSLRQKERFERYRGAEVEWSGKLKTFFSYSSDFTFGPGSGIKATFELEEIRPAGSIMPIRIKAVAAFPKDAAPQFSGAYGKTFRFRGKLLKMEPIAREIYLSDSSLPEGSVES